MQIVDALDVIRCDTLLFHLFAVVGYILPYMVYLLYQFLVLNGYDLFPRSTFNLFLEIVFHWYKTSYAFFPSSNAFLFISRNLAGTIASIAFCHASSGILK